MRREAGKRVAAIQRRAATFGCGAVLLLGSIGFAHAGLFDDDEARKQVAVERQRVDELKNDLTKQQEAVEARIVKLEEALKSQALLDLFTQLEALKLDLNKLRGQIEVLNNNVENTAKRQRDMYVDLDTRLRRFEQQGAAPASAPVPPAAAKPGAPVAAVFPAATPAPAVAPAAAPAVPAAPTGASAAKPAAPVAAVAPAATPAPTVAPAPPAPVKPATPAIAPASPATVKPTAPAASAPPVAAPIAAAPPAVAAVAPIEPGVENRAYEAAQGQRRIGNYQGSIVAFQNFINQYPKNNLAPRAQYWIGDSYFNLRDYKLAIANQQTLIKNYPDSPSVPDAMLNIASSQIEMGELNAGGKTLEDLIAKYPVSEAADKARRRLATLRAPAPASAPAAPPAAPKR
jgi:tol-pal system protein YbgF